MVVILDDYNIYYNVGMVLMLNDYNIYYNERLVATVRSTDQQSAIKTVWMRNSKSASRYSCWNLDDLKAEKARHG